MKNKKTPMAKITVKALNAQKARLAKVIKFNRAAIQKIKELSERLNSRTYNVSTELVVIPEYEQRLEEFRIKVSLQQSEIECLKAELQAAKPIELPKGYNALCDQKAPVEFWDKPKECLFKRFLKKLGFNG